jgi:hypothetical protein
MTSQTTLRYLSGQLLAPRTTAIRAARLGKLGWVAVSQKRILSGDNIVEFRSDNPPSWHLRLCRGGNGCAVSRKMILLRFSEARS